MDKDKSSETGYLSNMLDFPVNKEERVLAHILATKLHTDLAIDSQLEVRLNPTMKDLVINRIGAKKKRIKWQKKEESTTEARKCWRESTSLVRFFKGGDH
jgi:hypothetical protein